MFLVWRVFSQKIFVDKASTNELENNHVEEWTETSPPLLIILRGSNAPIPKSFAENKDKCLVNLG